VQSKRASSLVVALFETASNLTQRSYFALGIAFTFCFLMFVRGIFAQLFVQANRPERSVTRIRLLLALRRFGRYVPANDDDFDGIGNGPCCSDRRQQQANERRRLSPKKARRGAGVVGRRTEPHRRHVAVRSQDAPGLRRVREGDGREVVRLGRGVRTTAWTCSTVRKRMESASSDKSRSNNEANLLWRILISTPFLLFLLKYCSRVRCTRHSFPQDLGSRGISGSHARSSR